MLERASERIEFLNSDGTIPLVDLSKTGVAFHHIKAIDQGGVIRLQLNDLPLEAKVVYCQERKEGFRLGVQFQNVASDKLDKLSEIVDGFSRGVPTTCRVIE